MTSNGTFLSLIFSLCRECFVPRTLLQSKKRFVDELNDNFFDETTLVLGLSESEFFAMIRDALNEFEAGGSPRIVNAVDHVGLQKIGDEGLWVLGKKVT